LRDGRDERERAVEWHKSQKSAGWVWTHPKNRQRDLRRCLQGICITVDLNNDDWMSIIIFSLRRLNGFPWMISQRLRLSNWSQVSVWSASV
jgi:hypothetical protein